MTLLRMEKINLITKENMESFCEGKKLRKESVNEDLESLFEKIRLGKQPEFEDVRTYFLPKLTKEELELVEQKHQNYLGTFSWTIQNYNPDVDKVSMKLSESDSKFVQGRTTFKVEIENYALSPGSQESISPNRFSKFDLEHAFSSRLGFSSI